MFTTSKSDLKKDLAAIDRKTMALMKEFEAHYQDVIKINPAAEGQRECVFQAWTFQKLAGIHYSIEEIARKINAHLKLSE